MKKVLVTGAAGTVGLQVIRFLLSEGKYEVTALELKNKHVYKRLKLFKKRINIVYGDINDDAIVDALIKEHDIVIHCAGVLPPFANAREDLCKTVDFEGTKQIVDSIKNYNPNCTLLYTSSTSLYGNQEDNENITIKSNCNFEELDYYSKYKLKSEEYIKENLKNYTIFRLAYVLGDPNQESLIYNVKSTTKFETLSSEDAGYALVSAIDNKTSVNKKTFNLSGGEKFRITYKDYILNILRNYGLSIRFISTLLMAEKNYYGGYYEDSYILEDILHFRSKNIDVYYNTLEKYRHQASRLIPRILAIPFIIYYTKR